MKRTSLTLAAMLSIMPATIAHAQFGSGIVLDPTQSAHAITQIEHEERSISNQVQQIENGQQIFSNTVKIASTALQTYNQIKQQYNLYHEMMVAPRLLYGRFLSPTTDLMMSQHLRASNSLPRRARPSISGIQSQQPNLRPSALSKQTRRRGRRTLRPSKMQPTPLTRHRNQRWRYCRESTALCFSSFAPCRTPIRLTPVPPCSR